MSTPEETASLRLSVRALCDFTAREGDLDRRFSPSPAAREGQEGHAVVQARRALGWQAEVAVAGGHGPVQVRGRADLWNPQRARVEEIKTHRGPPERIKPHHRALHWAQAKVYGWLLAQAHGLSAVTVALVYFDVDRQTETVLEEHATAEALRLHFEGLCQRLAHWAGQELAHRQRRDAALGALRFPHEDFRDGQRPMSEAVWRAVTQSRHLLMDAPTGIGKTVGSLFPVLRAWPRSGLHKVFYLTARTPGRQRAVEAMQTLDTPCRTLELTALEKACEHPDKACHGQSCPLARGFWDRLPAARAQACQGSDLSRGAVRDIALQHAVCPYWLTQELVRWADVVVGDFNHWFDDSALLHTLSRQEDWQAVVLVDEAHNLLDRARGMYSATLRSADLSTRGREPPALLKKPLERLRRQWRQLDRADERAWLPLDSLPAGLERALGDVLGAFGELEDGLDATTRLDGDPPDADAGAPTVMAAALDPHWRQLHFDLLALRARLDTLSDHSVLVLERPDADGRSGQADERLSVHNLLPAPFTGPRFDAARATVLFSATLQPFHHHQRLLGLPPTTVNLQVPSPFRPEQLQVHVAREVSTRYADRARSMPALVQRIAAHWRARPGNWLAFFSSFEYLEQAHRALADALPGVPVWPQARRMSEAEREAFLDRFQAGGQGLGLAVLGGVFGEGIDLPGTRLVGACIATLGLPQFNPLNEAMRERLERDTGAGWDHAYLYPGLQKVVQAAGRVIRGPQDEGEIVLLDDRFCRPDVRACLPPWWPPAKTLPFNDLHPGS